MTAIAHYCEMCGLRLSYLQTLIHCDQKLSEQSIVDFYQCPIDRDDPCYPNSHYYLKLRRNLFDSNGECSATPMNSGVGDVAFKDYHFDKFRVSVRFTPDPITIFVNPEVSGEVVKSFDKVMTFEEICRYYKSWAFI